MVHLTENLTPEQKADAIIEWLVHNHFMRMTDLFRASQVVATFYGHDTNTSSLFESNGVFINTTIP